MKLRALAAALFAAAAFFFYTASVPASAAGEQTLDAPSPAPSASASATKVPQILTPPDGWKPRPIETRAGSFRADHMWVGPPQKGIIITGHLDRPDLGTLDLNSLDALAHKEMIAAAGAKGVQPSTRVKICGGKQDGTLTKVTITNTKVRRTTAIEEIVLAASDRGYIAEYVRNSGAAQDPAAMRSLLSLCAP